MPSSNSCDPAGTQPRAPRVLVFDSGVGSLSIGAEIRHLSPDLDLLYAMDRGGFPYGQWEENALVEHICRRVTQLLARHDCDMLVMACNSASTAVLPALRGQVRIPVVGVVPAIKPAAQRSRSGVIGLLATPGTISRPYTAQLIRDFADHCHVLRAGDPALAPAVEALFWNGTDDRQAWRRAVELLAEQPRFAEMDTLVLACTHFPLVQRQLADAMGAKGGQLHWIDSGEAIARRVAQLLHESRWTDGETPRHQASELANRGRQQAVVLGEHRITDTFAAALLARGIELISGW